jgi:hypothetical protein
MSDGKARSDLVKIETPNGVFHTGASDLITSRLVDFGAHTRNELAMVFAHIDEADVCIDIGAHIGTFATRSGR